MGKVEKLDNSGDVVESEEIEVGEMLVDEPMANVGLKVGKTINLGNFESLRVDVSLFMPSKTDKKSLDKTLKKCLKWVDKKMDEVVN